MPRKCSVCSHPERDKLDQALMVGETLRDIARRWSVSKDALARHKADHLPAVLVKAQEAQEAARADDLLSQVKAIMARVQKLFDACDAWLTDPVDLARYDIGPRAEDIMVIYIEEGPDGKQEKHKARLSSLLARVGDGRRDFEVIEVKHADPRELVLKTANTLRAALEMMLKVTEAKELEARLEDLEKAMEEREGAWGLPNGSQRSRIGLSGRR